MDAETNITSRTSGKLRGAHSEVRPEKARERQFEPYRPRGLQDVPPALKSKLENEGWHTHWVRIMLDGDVDSENLADVKHKGYEPVDVNEVPENILKTLKTSDVAGFKGLIVSKDTALFKIPQERFEEIRNYYTRIADSQLRSVNETIKQNASVHGLTVELYDESKSQIAIGESARKVASQEDKE